MQIQTGLDEVWGSPHKSKLYPVIGFVANMDFANRGQKICYPLPDSWLSIHFASPLSFTTPISQYTPLSGGVNLKGGITYKIFSTTYTGF